MKKSNGESDKYYNALIKTRFFEPKNEKPKKKEEVLYDALRLWSMNKSDFTGRNVRFTLRKIVVF